MRNGESTLPALFAGLAGQTLPRDRFEVLLVDDSSSDRSAELALAWAAEDRERRRLLAGDGRGPASARNAGIRASSGTWVAFTDSDTSPDARWLESALKAATERGAQAIEGAVVPLPADPDAMWTRGLRNLDGGLFVTANMLYRRELLERLGGFDERFEAPFLEDSDLAFRALDLGIEIPFCRDAVVYHPTLKISALAAIWRTRNLRWLALFAARHPARYRSQLRHGLRPLTANDLKILCGLAAGAGALWATGVLRAVLLAVLAFGLVRALRSSRAFAGPLRYAPGRGALGVAIPVAKAVSWLAGCLRFRKAVW